MKSLHQLVHSLSQNEKRYIKIQHSGHKANSKTLKYFDIISKQKEYDEAELLDHKDASLKEIKALRGTLKKLYDSILKHLRLFKSDRSVDTICCGYLQDTWELIGKGMSKEACKMNAKFLAFCDENEAFDYKIKALEIAQGLKLKNWVNDNTISSVGEEMGRIMKLQSNHIEYQRLLMLMQDILGRTYADFQVDASKEYNVIMQHPLLEDESKPLSDKARVFYHEIHANFAKLNDDVRSQLYHRKKLVDVLFYSPVYATSGWRNKIICSRSLLTLYVKLGNKKEAQDLYQFTLDKCLPMTEKVNNPNLQNWYQKYLYQGKLGMMLALEDYEGLDELADQLKTEGEVIFQDNSSFWQIESFAKMSEMYIYKGDNKSALKWALECNNYPDLLSSPTLYLIAQLQLLIIYYKLEKTDALFTRLQSVQRRIKKHDLQLPKAETALLKFFSLYVKDPLNAQKHAKKMMDNHVFEERLHVHFVSNLLSKENSFVFKNKLKVKAAIPSVVK